MSSHHAHLTSIALDSADLHTKVVAGVHAGAYGANDLKTPSDAQAQAGNYKMGRITVLGLRIAIEQPQGSIRTGKDSDGNEWSSRMAAHYGYFEGTKGADGDGIDCFVGPFPESETVFVVNQRNKGGGFDEHKVMAGFMSERHARGAYLDSYEHGWAGLQSMVPLSLPQFRWWLKHGNKLVALTAESIPHEASTPMTKKIYWTDTQPDGVSLDQVLYELRRMDGPDGLLLDSVTMAEIMEDTDGVIALDALVVENAQLSRLAERLRAIMDRSGGRVKAQTVQVSEPFKARGVTNIATVFEMSDGQTVSIFFHNPDTAPNKLAPGDEMISWKWLLNKKDITIVVAPEKGQDLNPRLVAQRIMKLAEKNSPAFQKANAKRAERMGSIQAIRERIATKEATLSELVAQVEVARMEREQKAVQQEDGNASTREEVIKWLEGSGYAVKDAAMSQYTKTVGERLLFVTAAKSLITALLLDSSKLGRAALNPNAPDFHAALIPSPEGALQPAMSYAAGYEAVTGFVEGREGEGAVLPLGEDGAVPDTGEFSVGSVKLVPFSAKSKFGKRIWGVRVVESGLELNAADGKGSWFKNDTKAIMTADLQRSYANITMYGDPTKNENSWRKNFGLPPFANQETHEELNRIALVDAAYQFDNATDAFKARVAESIEETDYSEFATAKAMDMKAKALGAEIHWGIGAALDSVHPMSKYKFEKGEKVKHVKTGEILTVIRSVRPGGYVFVEELQDAVSPQDLLIKKNGGFVALDSVKAKEGGEEGEGKDEDDFDPEAEFDACPVEDAELDGDFKGHPFRGNQHKKASAHSHLAVRASMSAKHAEKDGDTKGAKSAHKSAHYSHMAAAEGTTGKSRKYHRKMAKFHGSRAGMTLDGVEGWDGITLDDASDFQDSIVGKIMQGGELKGRAVIGGDGKAMVFVGESDDQRVRFVFPESGRSREAIWGDDGDKQVAWLLALAASPVAEPADQDPAPSVPFVEVFAFKDASDEALGLLRIGAQNTATHSAYKAAISVEQSADANGMTIRWEAVNSLPAFDDATGGLFGDGDSGHIRGDLAYNGIKLAQVYVREDGMAAFDLERVVSTETIEETMQDEGRAGWHDGWEEVISMLKKHCDENGVAQPEESPFGRLYEYEVTEDKGGGWWAKFKNEAMSEMRAWSPEKGEVIAKAETAISLHKSSPYLGRRWNSPYGGVVEGVKLAGYPTMGEGSESYEVKYPDGSYRRFSAESMESRIAQDEFDATPEGIKAAQDASEKYQREAEARRTAEDAAKADNDRLDAKIKEFTDYVGYSARDAGKAREVLKTSVNFIDFGGVMRRMEFVEKSVTAGFKTSTEQVKKIKDKTRHQFNRMDQREQDEHEARQKAAGTKAEYQVGNFTVTKTEFDYANFLIGKSAAASKLEPTLTPDLIDSDQAAQILRDAGIAEENLAAHWPKPVEANVVDAPDANAGQMRSNKFSRKEVEDAAAKFAVQKTAPAPAANAKDRAFFMSLIDGTYPDLDDPELVNNLEAAYQRNSEDAEMVSLFTQAINAYTTASLAETEGM